MRWHPTTYYEETSPPPPPYLPIDQHRRPVTPVSPDDIVPIRPAAFYSSDPEPVMGPFVARNGTFFQRLPPEIRTKILEHAFGNRTLHIDLIYGYLAIPSHEAHHHGGVWQLP
ncbi:hypothetical protein NW762_001571 [Fusarium torreyae]|uniref:Uncharacterized protein n=1 Tax=Fusarium torreyae TaxID=1237075 RepID=A0A9W8VLN9_9HYPO|nr:hypothetical protein NW762_001571 [Fusarium torreyae]